MATALEGLAATWPFQRGTELSIPYDDTSVELVRCALLAHPSYSGSYIYMNHMSARARHAATSGTWEASGSSGAASTLT